MKKIRLILHFALIVALSVLVLAGCKKEDKVSSVSLKNYDPSSVIEMPVGAFDYSALTVVVTYDSGSVEELPLTESMIDEADLFKFYQVGEHDITVVYGKYTCSFKISVKRSTFGELKFPENNVFTYDGKEHKIEIEGELPANATVTYPGGNSFMNAGTYDVNAIVSCEGYVTLKLSTTVKIERAVYDMSKVKFEPKEADYNGQPHSVAISGTLPEGVSKPTYVIDEKITSSAIDVGEYTVTAIFSHKNPNYEPIPNMVTTLKINPANYTIRGVDIVFKEANGKIIEKNSRVYDGTVITFDINDYNKLSSKISVSFSVYDKDDNLISSSNKETKIVDAGIYKVVANFTLADGKNYNPIAPVTAQFEVLKAEYVLSDIDFTSERFVYDGAGHSIKIEGTLPDDVSVSYEYYLNDLLLKDGDGNPVQSVVDSGRYTVKAVFTHTDVNRNEIASLSAIMQIAQATFDTSSLDIEFNGADSDGELVYDGKGKSVTLKGTLPEGTTVSYEYYVKGTLVENTDGTVATEVIEAGEYTVFIKFSTSNKNYLPISDMSYIFVVEKAGIDASGITIAGEEEYEYDGNEHAPSINVETIPADVYVTHKLYSVDVEGNRTEITSAKDAGKYVMVYTITPKDPTNYCILPSEEIDPDSDTITLDFVINPKERDVSGVELINDSFTFNGENQHPDVTGLPENTVPTMVIYSSDGSEPLDAAINAGTYRCVVTLRSTDSNYAIPAETKYSMVFVINKMVINPESIAQFDETETKIKHSGYDNRASINSLVENESNGYLTCEINSIGKKNGEGTGFEVTDLVIEEGKYSVKILVTIKEECRNNYVFEDGFTVEIYRYFEVVAA